MSVHRFRLFVKIQDSRYNHKNNRTTTKKFLLETDATPQASTAPHQQGSAQFSEWEVPQGQIFPLPTSQQARLWKSQPCPLAICQSLSGRGRNAPSSLALGHWGVGELVPGQGCISHSTSQSGQWLVSEWDLDFARLSCWALTGEKHPAFWTSVFSLIPQTNHEKCPTHISFLIFQIWTLLLNSDSETMLYFLRVLYSSKYTYSTSILVCEFENYFLSIAMENAGNLLSLDTYTSIKSCKCLRRANLKWTLMWPKWGHLKIQLIQNVMLFLANSCVYLIPILSFFWDHSTYFHKLH